MEEIPQDRPEADPAPRGEVATATSEGPLGEEQVLEALKHVIDPELGINIVDLGLVYDVEITPEGLVHVEYTLTTMGCPIGPLIEQQMDSFLAGVPGVTRVEAEMVLRPPWSPEMMSEEAKAALGYF
ncbi:MAG: metal-sulfur cluster assembly factor [Actinomycetota bacterium]